MEIVAQRRRWACDIPRKLITNDIFGLLDARRAHILIVNSLSQDSQTETSLGNRSGCFSEAMFSLPPTTRILPRFHDHSTCQTIKVVATVTSRQVLTKRSDLRLSVLATGTSQGGV